jgi:hypothetical protein
VNDASLLWRRVHKVELARVFHDLWHTRVVPDGVDRLADLHLQRLLGVRIDGKFHQIVAVIAIDLFFRFNLELAHGHYESLCTVYDILEDGVSVHGELFRRVSILVDNLHLFDDG